MKKLSRALLISASITGSISVDQVYAITTTTTTTTTTNTNNSNNYNYGYNQGVTNPRYALCPERVFELIYGKYCDNKIVNISFYAVKIAHKYGGGGFNESQGLKTGFFLNDNTDIVGEALTSAGDFHAVRLNIGASYFSDHYFTDLGIRGLASSAQSINNIGTIAGTSQRVAGSDVQGDTLWHSQVGFNYLLNALGETAGVANGTAFNKYYTEFVSGYALWDIARGGDGLEHGFVWSFDGSSKTVSVIGGSGVSNRARGVNDSKTATGEIIQNGISTKAYRWKGGVLSLLADLGGTPNAGLRVNNNVSEKIVGYVTDGVGKKHAALWTNGALSLLPALTNELDNEAHAVTDGGDIVGRSGTTAVFWRGGVVYDLNTRITNTPGTIINDAIAINRHGRILSKGADGFFYLLIPAETVTVP